MNAIEFNHVNKSFGSFAIEDLNLTVPTGTICGLVGENGAGKSTSIKLLLNALRPDSGTIQVLGTDTCDPAYVAVKNDIGVVLDDAWFPETITAEQVGVHYGRYLCKLGFRSIRKLSHPFLPAPGQEIQRLLPRYAHEVVYCRSTEP